MIDQVYILADSTPGIPIPDDIMRFVYLGLAGLIVLGVLAAVVAAIKKIPWWVWLFAIAVIAVSAGYINLK